MNEREEIAQQLAGTVREHKEEIAASLAERDRFLADSHYNHLSQEELRASARRALTALADALNTSTYTALDAYLTDVSLTRLRSGFDSGEVTEGLLLCKEAVLPVMLRIHGSDSALAWAMSAELDACTRWMAGRFNALYTAETKRRFREEHERTALMLDVVHAANSTLELDEVLRRVAQAIATALGAPHCGIFLVDEEQGTITRKYWLTDQTVREAFAQMGIPTPEPSAPLTELPFHAQVVASKEPLWCDVQADSRFQGKTARALGFRATLVLPFVVKGRVVALAQAGLRDEARSFKQEQIDLACGLASQAAIIIENASLYQCVKEIAIVEERDRLAGELHDHVSQTLSAINWRAATVDRLLSRGQVNHARESLQELRALAKQEYAQVRQAIYDLRSSTSLGSDFLPALEDYVAEYRENHGLEVVLLLEAQPFPRLPLEVRLQVIRIIQEALNNVGQHAGASRVTIRFSRDGDRLCMRIEDHGRGFDPGEAQRQQLHHFGLSIMRERAASVGGELSIESRNGQGTRVTLWLPITGAT